MLGLGAGRSLLGDWRVLGDLDFGLGVRAQSAITLKPFVQILYYV